MSSNKYLNKDFWLKASDNLYHQGKATELAEDNNGPDASLFESSNINLPNMAELSESDAGGDTFLERLCEELEAMYPLSNPSPKDDDRVIMYRAGQRAVVEYIKAKHNTEK